VSEEIRPLQTFGEGIIEATIASYFGKGYYDFDSFSLLVELFKKLSNTSFEGRNFTTGLILTRSHYAYNQKNDSYRNGSMIRLLDQFKIEPSMVVDKRKWYLVDGQTSYYVCNKELAVRNVFMMSASKDQEESFLDFHSLRRTIRGGDALFRVTSRAEVSISDSQ